MLCTVHNLFNLFKLFILFILINVIKFNLRKRFISSKGEYVLQEEMKKL